MNVNELSPALISLLAKTIILSKGGTLRFPRNDAPTLFVNDDDSSSVEVSISAAVFSTGTYGTKYWNPDGFHIVTSTGAMLPLEPPVRLRVWSYIVEHFNFPGAIPSEEELADRLEIRMCNVLFICEHGDLTEEDFDLIRERRCLFQKDREAAGQVPLPGDTVAGTYFDGACPFGHGVIETHPFGEEDRLSVCTHPYGAPWAHERGGRLYVNTSGGPYFCYDPDQLEHVGDDTRLFTEWGHAGVCAHGTVTFPVEVASWRLREGADEED